MLRLVLKGSGTVLEGEQRINITCLSISQALRKREKIVSSVNIQFKSLV
jgi:hypothetical protein